ncbi:MAG: carbon storage regulator CsrA [Planctomycetes bacterium]|nr:carbon storage regulator CsrA [Planctomycetota bacterium]
MLVLNRKVGERIVIGDEIVITVVSVHGQQVRVGIEAPGSVPIWREELLNTAAASRPAPDRRESRPAEVSC